MTNANRSLSVIVDDTRKDELTFGGPASWTSSNSPQWFNESAHTPTFALNNSGAFGSMTLEFVGTSAAFIGVTPPVFAESQIFTVKIDDLSPYNTTYGDPNPPSYRQWFQSPTLPDGKHTILLNRIAGATFDYAVVAAGPSTLLLEQRAIVDNDDNTGSLVYTGRWKRNSEQFNSGPGADGFPYQNTTHQAFYTGDSMTFMFRGKAAAVYGVFTWSNIGVLSLNFTLDGSSMIRKYQVKADTPQFVSELGQQPNFQFQSYDFLDSGDHNLTVSIVECLNQTFIFDYITYQPTFASISDMPAFVMQPGHSADLSKSQKRIPKGIIIGACAGALFLTIALVAICLIRKRPKKSGTTGSKRGKYVPIEPFTLHSQNAQQQASAAPTATSSGDLPSVPFGQYQAEPFELHPTHHHRYHESASARASISTYQYPPHSVSYSDSLGYTREGQETENLDNLLNAPPPPSYQEISNDEHHLEVTYVVRRG